MCTLKVTIVVAKIIFFFCLDAFTCNVIRLRCVYFCAANWTQIFRSQFYDSAPFHDTECQIENLMNITNIILSVHDLATGNNIEFK